VENDYLDQNYIGKTKAAEHKIPLNASALAIIKRRTEAAKGSDLFPHRRFRLYDCRHTWATRAAGAGMDTPTLRPSGHSKLAVVMRYCHLQEKHQAEAAKPLEVTNAAKEFVEFENKNRPKLSLQFPLQLLKIRSIFRRKNPKVTRA
jgi:integrase